MDIMCCLHKVQLAINNRLVTSHTECTNNRQLLIQATGSANTKAVEYSRYSEHLAFVGGPKVALETSNQITHCCVLPLVQRYVCTKLDKKLVHSF